MAPKESKKRKAEEPKQPAPEEQLESEPSDEGESEDEGEGSEEGDDLDLDTDYGRFMQEIKDREEQLGKFCMVLGQIEPDSDEDEDEAEEKQPSMEQLLALPRVYLPKQFEQYFEEVGSQLEEIGCSSPEMSDDDDEPKLKLPPGMPKFTLRMLNTRHSLPMHAILHEKLKKVDKAIKAQDWPEAFCWWAATTLAAKGEAHWWGDTEDHAVAEGIYKKLRTQWVKLKEHSDEELGGLVLDGGSGSVKTEFDNFLQGLAEDMRPLGYNVPDVVSQKGRKKK